MLLLDMGVLDLVLVESVDKGLLGECYVELELQAESHCLTCSEGFIVVC